MMNDYERGYRAAQRDALSLFKTEPAPVAIQRLQVALTQPVRVWIGDLGPSEVDKQELAERMAAANREPEPFSENFSDDELVEAMRDAEKVPEPLPILEAIEEARDRYRREFTVPPFPEELKDPAPRDVEEYAVQVPTIVVLPEGTDTEAFIALNQELVKAVGGSGMVVVPEGLQRLRYTSDEPIDLEKLMKEAMERPIDPDVSGQYINHVAFVEDPPERRDWKSEAWSAYNTLDPDKPAPDLDPEGNFG